MYVKMLIILFVVSFIEGFMWCVGCNRFKLRMGSSKSIGCELRWKGVYNW